MSRVRCCSHSSHTIRLGARVRRTERLGAPPKRVIGFLCKQYRLSRRCRSRSMTEGALDRNRGQGTDRRRSTDRDTTHDHAERGVGSQWLRWFLLRGDRLVLTGVISLCVFVISYALIRANLLEIGGSSTMSSLLDGAIAGLLTVITWPFRSISWCSRGCSGRRTNCVTGWRVRPTSGERSNARPTNRRAGSNRSSSSR